VDHRKIEGYRDTRKRSVVNYGPMIYVLKKWSVNGECKYY